MGVSVMERVSNKRWKSRQRWGLAVAACLLVPVVACSADAEPQAGRAPTTSVPETPVDAGSEMPAASPSISNRSTAGKKVVWMTFDGLGGSYDTVEVYPGYTNAATDKTYSSVYRVGERVMAACKVKGRSVSSHPELGEEERTPTTDWIRIGNPVASIEYEYATAMYIADAPTVLAQLPDCK